MTKGLFQVRSSTTNSIEGTAFAVDRIPDLKKYYIVTAYHVVAEIISKEAGIILTDDSGGTISVTSKPTTKQLEEYLCVENDYAILEAFSEIDYEVFNIGDYRRILPGTTLSTRGSTQRPHFKTSFSPFNLIYNGSEKTESQKEILVITDPSNDYYGSETERKSTKEILRGISGGPILVYKDDQEICIGIMSQIGCDHSNPIRYAVPILYAWDEITKLKAELDNSKNKQITTEDYYSVILNYNVDYKKTNHITAGDFLDAIFGINNDFEFSNDKEDKRIWDHISNSYFKNGNIDKKLNFIIQSEDFEDRSSEIQCAVLYYYARLLFKRGQFDDALATFARIKNMSTSLSQESYEKANALIQCRSLVEYFDNSGRNPSNILRVVDHLDRCLKDTEYKAYEMASILGKGTMNLFQEASDLNESEKKDVIQIYNNQIQLYNDHPKALIKQEVVITSVEWYLQLWHADNNFSINDIDATIKKGLQQANKLHNNIFHIQCLMVMMISFLIKNEPAKAIQIFIIVSKLMHKIRVTFLNEGISQLIAYTKKEFYPYFLAFMFIYKNINENLIKTYIKLETLKINLGKSNWKNTLENGVFIYSLLYEPAEGQKRDISPYTISYNDLLVFFN